MQEFSDEDTIGDIHLSNKNGIQCRLSNFGARILGIQVPLPDEKRDIVVSLINKKDIEINPYFGAIVGRVAGRIRSGKPTIDGKEYHFEQNEGTQTLHGGRHNFSNQFWKIRHCDDSRVTFSLTSPNGDSGFPGNVFVEVTYELTDANQLLINYQAAADQATLFNPTNHVFFNLDGDATHSVAGHSLQINADSFLPLDNYNLPLRKKAVDGTIFDFKSEKTLGTILSSKHPQVEINKGINHSFLLRKSSPQLRLTSKDKKITVEMTTSQSAVVVYTTGSSLIDSETNSGSLGFSGAIALEAQMPPDTENSQENSKVTLQPGTEYHAQTIYKIKY